MEDKNNEIDLIQIFSSIGDKSKNLFIGIYKAFEKLFLKSLYFGIRNYIVILILIITSFVVKKSSKLFYKDNFESHMKVRANAIQNQEAIGYLNRLSDLAQLGNIAELAKQLEIDVASASKIKDIGSYWFIDKDGDGIDDYIDFENAYIKAADDSISRRITEYFSVRVEYSGMIDVNLIGNKVLAYYNRNPYFVRANEIRKKQQQETLQLTKIEQTNLDTIRTQYNKSLFENKLLPETRTGQLVFLNGEKTDLQKIKLFHPDIFELDGKAQNIARDLELNPEIITVIENFTDSKKPVNNFTSNNKYSLMILFGGLIGLILFENRKKISELRIKSAQQK